MVGDQNSGKSSIIIRYVKNDFDRTSNVIVGILVAYNRNRFHFEECINRRKNNKIAVMGYSRSGKVQKFNTKLFERL
jgi:GTPase SAR1 family protein